MGMFDYVKCEYPLPHPEMQEAVFQTKDTDAAYLKKYRITKEGRLIHETVRYEMVPLAERPYPDENDWRSIMGSMRSVPTGDVDTKFHGALHFYTDHDGQWFEYFALFKDGDLIDLRTVSPVPRSEGEE
ncbi:MAG: hypothetical protein O9306_12460 [Beijerinckiaceae bacterium]|jgi:hypothetical protein|nr:hypothetical protein [Methylobacterium sp.]MCZ8271346.1 hypothetical protein [Beijerinckiaceae bacterium]